MAKLLIWRTDSGGQAQKMGQRVPSVFALCILKLCIWCIDIYEYYIFLVN